jgi:hypothetical protein
MEKYDKYRNEIPHGSIGLWHGTGWLSSIIRRTDKTYWNHIGVFYWINGRLAFLDMWKGGLVFVPASQRAKIYTNLCVLVPQVNDKKFYSAINACFEKWEQHIDYDYFTLLRIWLIKKLRIDLKFLGKSDKYICSEFVQFYCNQLGIDNYNHLELPTPGDFIRFKDDKLKLLQLC